MDSRASRPLRRRITRPRWAMGRLGVEATSHLEAMRLMAKVAMQAHRASLSSLPRSLLRAHSPSQVLCSCEHTTASYSKNIYGQSLATHKQALFAAGSANFISNIFCSIYVRTVHLPSFVPCTSFATFGLSSSFFRQNYWAQLACTLFKSNIAHFGPLRKHRNN